MWQDEVKMEGKILKKHLFSTFIAIVTCLSIQVTAFAAEPTVADISVCSNDTVDETNSEGTVYGSLSGYASYTYVYGVSKTNGSFPIEVKGSWSPWAGWTLKTDVPDGSWFTYVYLTRPDGTKIGDTLYPSAKDEIKNQALVNVPPGTYTVNYGLNCTGNGTITVWIY